MPNIFYPRRQGSFALPDQSASFTGTARLTTPNSGSRFNPPNDTALTIAAWVYPTQLTASTYYLYAGVVDGTAPGDGWFMLRSGGSNQFEVGYSNGSTYSLVDGFTPTVNNWYMLVGTFLNTTGDKGFTLQVFDTSASQGVFSQSGTGFINASATGDLYVGTGAAGVNPANARIDKFGIWFTTLSGGQTTALWNNGIGLRGSQLAGAGLTTGLQYWWDLDGGRWESKPGGSASLVPTGSVGLAPPAGR